MIYFIKSGSGHVKIGYTGNSLNMRMSALQSCNPHELSLLKVIDGDMQGEKSIHKKFNTARTRGEWFILTDELVNFIESLNGLEVYIPKKKKKLVNPVDDPADKFVITRKHSAHVLRNLLQATCANIEDIKCIEGIAKRCSLKKSIILGILNEKISVTIQIARAIEKGVGMKVAMWRATLNAENGQNEVGLRSVMAFKSGLGISLDKWADGGEKGSAKGE